MGMKFDLTQNGLFPLEGQRNIYAAKGFSIITGYGMLAVRDMKKGVNISHSL